MEQAGTAERIRQERERLGHICGANPLPEALKREALACFRARRAEGASTQAAAAELGLSALTLWRWAQQSRVAFAPVVVAPEPPAVGERLVVHGPHGLRIEGLDVAGLAELLRRLG